MASTWSSLGIRLMTTGENANAWGDQTNQNWERLEDAADGLATVAVSGATTLTFTAQPTSYADENGRNKVLVFTGTAGGTQAITFPNIEKTYHVLNDSNSTLTLTTGTGAATVSLEAGKDKIIYNDGSDEIHDALANLAITTLDLSGNATVDGTALVTGVLTTTAATVFNGGFASNAASTITTTGNENSLSLISTDADAQAGPILRLARQSSSPQDGDSLGAVQWQALDDGAGNNNMIQLIGSMTDASAGSEDATLFHYNTIGGATVEMVRYAPTGVVFNEGSTDLDFRVEGSSNTHSFFVDAGNDHVNIGASGDLGGRLNVHGNGVFQNADQTDTLSLLNTDADANVGPRLKFGRNSASPAVNDLTGDIRFEGKDDGGNDFVTAQIRTQMTGVSNGSEEGKFWIETMKAGTARQRMSIAGAETIFNEDSVDVDFRVESNGKANMLFVDGGNNRVGIGDATDVAATLVVSDGDAGVTTPDANGNVFVIEKNDNCGMSILSSTDGGGYIHFGDSGDADIGVIEYSHPDNSMRFTVNTTEKMKIHSNGTLDLGASSSSGGIFVNRDRGGDYAIRAYNSNNSNPTGVFIFYSAAAPDSSGGNQFLRCQDTGAVRLDIRGNGDVLNHDNTYGSLSDERIKQDIRDSNSQWEDIKAVKIRNYKKKDDIRQYGDNAAEQIGVVAQELEAVSPKLIKHNDPSASDIISSSEFGTLYTSDDAETQDAVLYTADDQEVINGDKNVGDIKTPSTKQIGEVKEITEQVKSVNYSVLYLKAIKALQEAMTRIETLETKVAALES